jgi:hypothetical protein
LQRADYSSKESYRLCDKDYETEEEAMAQQKAVESLMNEQKIKLPPCLIKHHAMKTCGRVEA